MHVTVETAGETAQETQETAGETAQETTAGETAQETQETAGETAQETAENPWLGVSDEEYARLALPDGPDGPPDRSLLTPMAARLREAGIPPETMGKVAAAYREAVDAECARQDEERRARMAEAARRCREELTPEEWRDWQAAYSEHIVKDPFLKRIFDETELGSSAALLRLAGAAGRALRADDGVAGSGSGADEDFATRYCRTSGVRV